MSPLALFSKAQARARTRGASLLTAVLPTQTLQLRHLSSTGGGHVGDAPGGLAHHGARGVVATFLRQGTDESLSASDHLP